MKNEFKNGDAVIWNKNSKSYYFIGMSITDINQDVYGKNLNCVIERNGFIAYANKEDLKLKPETVQHPGGEMPKPLSTEEAEKGDFIYVPNINSRGVLCTCYTNLSTKRGYAELGHAYATEQDASDAGHVMFNIPKGE